MQPSFDHIPVMLPEALAALGVRPGGRWLDGTAGGGGHSEAILAATSPTGFLWACDQDGDALEATARRLAGYAGRFELRRMNFAEIGTWVPAGSCDGVLLDLGVSSHQLDTGDRGFSFQQDGPLDMRMDRRSGLTAADVVNDWPEADLVAVLRELGEEPAARRIARAVVDDRQVRRMTTTGQLAACVARVIPRRGRTHPATRTFQAIRLAVNRELDVLPLGLEAGFGALAPGGRLVVITFHSLEDRIVKRTFRDLCRDYDFPGAVDVPELRVPRVPRARAVTRSALAPGDAELAVNPRARSARLRAIEKL